MRFDSFDEIRRYAIREEIDSANLYRMFAQRSSAGTRKMFEELAAEEDKHKTALEKIDMEAVRRHIPANVPDLKISDYMMEVKYSEDMTPRDAMVFAMKAEEKAKKMYTDMSNMVTDPELKKFFEMLAREESRHKLRLEKMFEDEFIDQKW